MVMIEFNKSCDVTAMLQITIIKDHLRITTDYMSTYSFPVLSIAAPLMITYQTRH